MHGDALPERITPHLPLLCCKTPVLEEEGEGGTHSPGLCSCSPETGCLPQLYPRHCWANQPGSKMIKPEFAETSRGRSHRVDVTQVEMRLWGGWEPCSRLEGQEWGKSTVWHQHLLTLRAWGEKKMLLESFHSISNRNTAFKRMPCS